jgi:sulfonate transport system substrate-binding protein
MKTVRVCGVPEHFNYPWHYAINNGLFAKAGFDVHWSDVTGGSGEMCRMLEENQTDVALVLTEGIVKHIHTGGTTRIIQQYVKYRTYSSQPGRQWQSSNGICSC